MKKLTLFLLLATLCYSESVAQSFDTTNSARSGFYLSVIGQDVDLDNLNRELEQAGIPRLTSGLVGTSMGFTNRFRDQNSYGNTQLSLLSTFDDGGNAESDARLTLWKISFAGQYDVIPSEKWLVYPYLQFGTNLAQLRVSSTTNVSSFQGSLSNLNEPDELVKRYSSGLFISGGLGAGVERRFTFPGTIEFIGLSAGYEVSPRSEWQTNGANYILTNSPSFRTNGWVFELRFRLEYDPTTLTDRERQPRGLFKFFQ